MTDESIAQYALGSFTSYEGREIEAHLSGCDSCRQRVERCRADRDLLRRMLAKAGLGPDSSDRSDAEPSEPSGDPHDEATQTPLPCDDERSALDGSKPNVAIEGYQILREISRGGQAVVYQAIQKSTKRRVAIKVMKEGPFVGQQEKARFRREVEILAELQHPNIVGIHDTGSTAGSFYYVMDYVSGKPLDDYVASAEPSTEETLQLFAKICNAVNAAHLRGVIHRDLKPSNIRVDPDGEPHILDFGLAKIATRGVTEGSRPQVITMTGEFFGSLPWASPEQAEAIPSKIDPRTDVYSLGVILYHMLTGQFPYEVAGNVKDVMDNILRAEPAKPSSTGRRIDNEVETIILKALSKNRERRYQSAGDFARDIRHYLSGEPIEAKRASRWYLLRKLMARHRYANSVVGLLLVIILCLGYLSVDLYLQLKKAQETNARKAREFGQMQEVLSHASETWERQDVFEEEFLLAWRQGKTSEARKISGAFPQGCRERIAMSFLLDQRSFAAKVGEFLRALGQKESGFAEYVVGEHHLRDGDLPAAIDAFRRAARVSTDRWLSARVRERLHEFVDVGKPKPPAAPNTGPTLGVD